MCNNPVLEKRLTSHGAIYFQRPCNGCMGCRIDRLLLWSARCTSEFIKYRSAFLTFTYDDIHLPYNEGAFLPTLRKLEFSKYIDNLRHKVKKLPFIAEGNTRDFSFFGCGEYGDERLRSHYHLLCFGLDFKEYRKLFESTWKNGHVEVLPVQSGGIRYVVDYMTECLTGKYAEREYDDKNRERPFTTCSQGLGSDLFLAHRDEISSTGCIKFGSRHVPVPVYYKNLCQKFDFDSIDSRLQLIFQNYKKTMLRAEKLGFTSYDDYMRHERYAREHELVTKYRQKGLPAFDFYVRIPEHSISSLAKECFKYL